MQKTTHWPNGAVVYQIYPRSFKDSNDDGVGDIPGIISKLDYLQDLGITAIWLSPFYRSPMADFGYDVADYRDVDPLFGTLKDCKELIAKAHAKDIRIIVDLVPNHTSDEHVWFMVSRQSRDNEYADYYIWRDPSGYGDDGNPLPPNNWVDVFAGESAWEWNETRGQYYLHSFNVHQPDLNWENPQVRREIQDVMRFWLDIGVNGFRVDAVNFISKEPSYTDDLENNEWEEGYPPYGRLLHVNSQSGPRLHEYLRDMAHVLHEEPYVARKPFMITEGYPQSPDHIGEYLAYYQGVDPAVSAPFCFEGFELPWEAGYWTGYLRDYHAALDTLVRAVPAYAFSNHDNPRPVTRWGEAVARSAAVLLLTLPGMVFIYNGDELGMENGVIPPELVVDPGAADGTGRDPERMPMQWSADKHGGFSSGKATWLPVHPNYLKVNAALQAEDPASFLSLYRSLCRLRSKYAALHSGSMEVFETGNKALLGYIRRHDNEAIMIVINFTDKIVSYKPESTIKSVLLSAASGKPLQIKDNILALAPHEAAVLQV